MKKLMGIDYGEKRIGIALSDEGEHFAFPYRIIENTGSVAEQIKNICEQEHVRAAVLGASRNYKGADNPIMKKIRAFAKRIELVTGLPVMFESEVLTSQEAKRGREEGSVRPVDDSAAAIILQSFLDKQKNNELNQ